MHRRAPGEAVRAGRGEGNGVTVGAHLIGWLVVAAVLAGAGALAVGMRRILLPPAAGARARLAEAVLAVSAVCVVIEVVGVWPGR